MTQIKGNDGLNMSEQIESFLAAGGVSHEGLKAMGHFEMECHDSLGNTLWEASFDNLVVTVGKNAMENQAFSSSAYTAANFMGLISSTSFSAIAAGDTMSSHAGWLEAGNAHAPTYTGSRATMTFGAASAGVIISTGNAFVFTGSGTVEGAFINFGAGATGTIDNTAGILFSGGTLATPQPVISGNTLTNSYTLTLT